MIEKTNSMVNVDVKDHIMNMVMAFRVIVVSNTFIFLNLLYVKPDARCFIVMYVLKVAIMFVDIQSEKLREVVIAGKKNGGV